MGVSYKRLAAFDACGADCVILQETTTGEVRCAAHHCHDRACEACQQARAATIRRNLLPLVTAQKTLHVVLTQVSTTAPLREQLTWLYACSSKLRATKWWRDHVEGGSQTLEETRNADSHLWHPHLHMLVHAAWIPLKELSERWYHITHTYHRQRLSKAGDPFAWINAHRLASHRVHVSLVDNAAAAIREVTKYVAKPLHRSIAQDEGSIAEILTALAGRRLINCFGTWRGTKLLTTATTDTHGDWRVVCTLHQLQAWAAAGDRWSRDTLAILEGRIAGRAPRPTQTPPHPP